MDIRQAKNQIKDTVEAYLAEDDRGMPLLDPSRQRPVFLIGAPGIGKTAIMAQIADELGIGLVSYSMTHHTRQSALGLPFITHCSYGDFEYEASEYTMSEIIASVYDYMRETGRERGILFLDEINCVSETLYPSMLQFLQFKTFGGHRVPEGWVVACAGNPPEYNRSVHEFDIVTLDRVKKIAVDPDYDAWRAYAVSKGVHPAVLTFLDIKKSKFYTVEASLDGPAFVTARGWDDLSEIMRVFESMGKTVDFDLIVQYVQNEPIAREFASYYDLFNKYRDDYRVDEILAGKAAEDVVERARNAAFDERLSLVGLVLDAIDGDVQEQMDDTDMLVSLRDDLRRVKAGISEGALDDVADALDDERVKRVTALEMSIASGVLGKRKRAVMEREVTLLDKLACSARASSDGGASSDVAERFACVEASFAREVDAVSERAGEIEGKIACAFAFFDEAFGDAQEVLVFTTELTSRTVCARYIAQYGSPSYFEHNQEMLLSERQSDLRRRVEELDV